MENVSQHHLFRFDEFLVDLEAWALWRDGREIHLEPTVLRLLVYLIEHRDRLVTREELMDTVWDGTVISDGALSKAVARLRKALGDHADRPRYVETVHSLGYRFLPSVEVEPPEQPAPTGSRAIWRKWRHGLVTAALAVGVMAVILVSVFWKEGGLGARQQSTIQSIAVFPLKNMTGDPDQQGLVDGLQDMLATELARLSGLRVSSSQSTKRFRNSELSLPEIAKELQVDAVVVGTVLSLDDPLRVTTQLIDSRSDSYLWTQSYERDPRDLLDLIAEAAADITAHARPISFEPAGNVPNAAPLDPEASRAFLEGLVHLNTIYRPGSLRRAVESFERAVALEPDFTLAWGNLAVAHGLLAMAGGSPPRLAVPRAREAALKALATDDRHYIGHSTLGWVRLWSLDWEGAAQAFDRALELNPSDYYALHGQADCLMLAGELEQSLDPIRESQVLDSFTPMSSMPLPTHLYMLHRYDEAIAQASAVHERIPSYSIHWLLARIYWQQRRFEESLEEERQELELRNDVVLLTALERGAARGGAEGALVAMAETLAERSLERYVDPFDIAVLFARAGEESRAIEWLSKALESGSPKLTYIGFWPDFDALRNEPRFESLMRRMNLPQR